MNTRMVSLAGVVLAVLCAIAGCDATRQVVDNAPAAMTPTRPQVFAVLAPGGGWANVGAGRSGAFEILPGALPSGGFQVMFDGVYPSTLRLVLDGAPLPKFEDAGPAPLVTGYYRIKDLRADRDPAQWWLVIRPPDAGLGSTRHVLEVFDVSINPRFPPGHPDHESAPMTVVLEAHPSYLLAVARIGDGRGHVTSRPVATSQARIECGIACAVDFGQSTTVELDAKPTGDAVFTGWAGECSGTGPCRVLLNGRDAAVTARFDAGSGAPLACPAPQAVAGASFAGAPRCASNDIAGHPSASLACDAGGFFCCESVQGAADPRCGAGKREFPPDCLFLGNLARLVQPYGCYLRD